MSTAALRPYPSSPRGARPTRLTVRGTAPTGAPRPRRLDRVREAVRARQHSRRTEKAYIHWIKRYIFLHGKRHPAQVGAPEVTAFLTALAVQGKVAAATQNQALSTLLFLYREVLGIELPWLEGLVRAKPPQRHGAGWVELPWGWRASTRTPAASGDGSGSSQRHAFTRTASPGQRRRHHLHESVVQRSVKNAVRAAGLAKPATCHTFRHSFATHLLESRHDIHTVQELLDNHDVSTIQTYTHVLNRGPAGVRSPADRMFLS